MRLLRPGARLATIAALLAGTAALVAAPSTAAYATTTGSAAPAASQDGWVRIAHLSPKAPAMDMYLYTFSNPGHATVLRDVGYGDVSAYMAVSPGQYTVAMRGFGAPSSSAPALSTTFTVSAGTAYTVAALGPDPGLRVAVLQDQMTAPAGQGACPGFPGLAQGAPGDGQLRTGRPGAATSLRLGHLVRGRLTKTFRPCSSRRRMSTPPMPVDLAANTIHTIVVLDDSSGLKIDALTDAVGSQIMPHGGANTGFGGTAPRLPGNPAPWLLTITVGALLTMAGSASLRRSRHAAAAGHKLCRRRRPSIPPGAPKPAGSCPPAAAVPAPERQQTPGNATASWKAWRGR